jgi:L-fucose isomerase
MSCSRPDFESLATTSRTFLNPNQRIVGHVATIALTPVADGRAGAYDDNQARTWKLVEKVYDLIHSNVTLPDGTPVRIVVAPEIVYGPRSGAIAQAYYATQGVCANIWVSRSWCYSDELMSACMGVGSSEWQQAAYGLNQTDRPGAVWLKAFTAAMDEKRRPIFSVYSPDLEDETEPFNDYVRDRLLRFARCATAVGYIRGKNYLNIGSVSMGIIGSDSRRNIFQQVLGMGTCNFDMAGIRGRLETGLYDHEEADRAFQFFTTSFRIDYGSGKRPVPARELLLENCKIACIVRDLMFGNPRLADPAVGKKQGFTANVEYAQGYNAVVSGTQGQRQWTDYYTNFDLTESILNSSFDWNGFRAPMVVATENDSKNGVGMLIGNLLSGGAAQLFADIRTNWTPVSIKKATGVDVKAVCPGGIIDKRNSGAGALDYATDIFKMVKGGGRRSIQDVMSALRADPKAQQKLIANAIKGTVYMGANLTYFPGDGLSSHYRTPGDIPMTAYRYNVVGDLLTCSVVEGQTVELPRKVADHISRVTDATWPETYWAPRGMSSFEYMNRIGPNHDANSFGLIGADFLTFNAMLRVPVDMHNVAPDDIFRPTMWDRFGGDDFRACSYLGAMYQ